MFVYKSQSGICFRLMRESKINARIKLTRFIRGEIHPKISDMLIIGSYKYWSACEQRSIMQTIKKILQINASLKKNRNLLAFSFTRSGWGNSKFISSLNGSMRKNNYETRNVKREVCKEKREIFKCFIHDCRLTIYVSQLCRPL